MQNQKSSTSMIFPPGEYRLTRYTNPNRDRYCRNQGRNHGGNRGSNSQLPVLILFICLLLSVTDISAEITEGVYDKYHYKTWGVASGLPSNVAHCLAKTGDGYLWVGTFSGFARFDGTEFDVYNFASCPELVSEIIRTILIDHAGDLWIGTDGGGLYRLRNNELTGLDPFNSQDCVKLDELSDGTLCLLASGDAWCLTPGDSLWTAGENEPQPISALAVSESDDICLGVDRDLIRFGADRSVKDRYHLAERTMRRGIVAGPDGLLVLHPHSMSLIRETGVIHLPFEQVFSDYRTLAKWETLGRAVNCATCDGRGGWWLGTRLGVFHMVIEPSPGNPDLAKLELVAPREITGTVNQILPDSNGVLWLASNEKGLVQLSPRVVTAIPMSTGSKLQLIDYATSVAGVSYPYVHVSNEPGRDPEFFSPGEMFPMTGISRPFAVSATRSGGIWVLHQNALALLTDGEYRWRTLPEDARLELVYYSPFEDLEGDIWVRYRNVNTGDGFLINVDNPSIPPLAGDRIITQTKDGAIWLTSERVLIRFFNGETTKYTRDDVLPSGKIRSAWEDQDGTLWLTTRGSGLLCVTAAGFISCTIDNGLPHNTLAGIIEDESGRIWINSNAGLFVCQKQALRDFASGKTGIVPSCIVYSAECNPGMARGDDGLLYFSCINGKIAVDPDALFPIPAPGQARIKSVVCADSTYSSTDLIKLVRDDRNFEIYYSAPSLMGQGNTLFRYRLSGVTRGWVDAGRRRAAYFTHISPGEYVFEVVAGNSDGHWADAGDSVVIEVPFVYHETLWFRLSASLICFVLLTMLFHVRLRRRNNYIAAITTQVNQRRLAEKSLRKMAQRLMNAQEEERRRIARDLHDDINQRLSMLAVELQIKENQSDADLSGFISSTQALVTDVQRISRALNPVHLEQLGLEISLNNLCEELSLKNTPEITCSVSGISADYSSQKSLHLYRITQEAIQNSLKYSGATRIEVCLDRVTNNIVLEIRDNGDGFDVKSRTGSGLGLLSMAERAAVIGGQLAIESERGHGTTVWVRIDEGSGAKHDETT